MTDSVRRPTKRSSNLLEQFKANHFNEHKSDWTKAVRAHNRFERGANPEISSSEISLLVISLGKHSFTTNSPSTKVDSSKLEATREQLETESNFEQSHFEPAEHGE